MLALAYEQAMGGQCKAHLHRSALGWTVDASILILQVS